MPMVKLRWSPVSIGRECPCHKQLRLGPAISHFGLLLGSSWYEAKGVPKTAEFGFPWWSVWCIASKIYSFPIGWRKFCGFKKVYYICRFAARSSCGIFQKAGSRQQTEEALHGFPFCCINLDAMLACRAWVVCKVAGLPARIQKILCRFGALHGEPEVFGGACGSDVTAIACFQGLEAAEVLCCLHAFESFCNAIWFVYNMNGANVYSLKRQWNDGIKMHSNLACFCTRFFCKNWGAIQRAANRPGQQIKKHKKK